MSNNCIILPPRLITDPNIALVSLLMHMEGPNVSQTFTDQMGSSISLTGSPFISTNTKKAGNSCMYLDGSSALRITDKPGFAMGTGDFAIEVSAHPSSNGASRIWSYQGNGGTNQKQVLIIGRDANSKIYTELRSGDGTLDQVMTSTTTAAINAFWDIAFTRQNGVTRLFINGNLEATLSGQTQDITSGGLCGIGYYQGGNNSYFNGYLDEIRVTKGAYRYNANYTPLAGAFPDQ